MADTALEDFLFLKGTYRLRNSFKCQMQVPTLYVCGSGGGGVVGNMTIIKHSAGHGSFEN